MSKLYRLHGLQIRSEIPLSADVSQITDQQHVEVKRGPDRSVSVLPPAGVLLAELTLPGGAGYSLTRSAEGYLLRFYRTCDIEISHDLTSLIVTADPDADPAMLPLLVEGNAVAVILGLKGEFVLHASAVSIGESALGFVGRAGMGKSTMAGVMCSAGASLVADDLLRVSVEDDRVICHRGPRVIRLRSGVTSLGLQGPIGASPDGRTTVKVTAVSTELSGLRALVIPQPSRSATQLVVRRFSAAQGLLQLARSPRVTGWKIDEPWRTHFRGASLTAKTVPIFSADIPWGPPFDGHLADHLLEAVQVVADRRAAKALT